MTPPRPDDHAIRPASAGHFSDRPARGPDTAGPAEDDNDAPPPAPGRVLLRLACTVALAVAFVILCRAALRHSPHLAVRVLAGPANWPYWSPEDVNPPVAVGAAALLAGMFAVGVWRNTWAAALSGLCLLGWVAAGMWVELVTCGL